MDVKTINMHKLKIERLARKAKERKERYPHGMPPPQAAMVPGISALVRPVVYGGDEIHVGI